MKNNSPITVIYIPKNLTMKHDIEPPHPIEDGDS